MLTNYLKAAFRNARRQKAYTFINVAGLSIGYVGPGFLEVFLFPFIQGNPETALQGVTSAVITDRRDRKLFGENWQTRGDVLGQSLTVDHRKEFTITVSSRILA